jgi:hypothetical protein
VFDHCSQWYGAERNTFLGPFTAVPEYLTGEFAGE